MKKDWIAEAKRRIEAEFKNVAMTYVMQRAAVSDRVLRQYGFSKTQNRKAAEECDNWIRVRLSRLAVLEVLLESRPGLGRRVWRLYGRMTEAMAKRTMVPVPGAVPADQRDPTKGAGNEMDHAVDSQAVPSA